MELLEFTIPTWAVCPLINADYSCLDDEEETKLNQFCEQVHAEYGNANFMLGDNSEETEFKHGNDIEPNMGGDVITLYLFDNN